MSHLQKTEYVDYHLQPIVEEIPSYVKDTKDFIQKLNQIEEITEDSLYTNILNNEWIKTVKEAYDKCLNKTVSTKIITTFLSLILTWKNFIFYSANYTEKTK